MNLYGITLPVIKCDLEIRKSRVYTTIRYANKNRIYDQLVYNIVLNKFE